MIVHPTASEKWGLFRDHRIPLSPLEHTCMALYVVDGTGSAMRVAHASG